MPTRTVDVCLPLGRRSSQPGNLGLKAAAVRNTVPVQTVPTPYHAKFLALHLTRRAEFGSPEVFAQALSDAQVDLNPHQIDAALFAARSPISKGALLADEVGLGKTIEAALLLAQRWAERRRKLLVIVPASLRKQWSLELAEKFHLPTVIVERRTILEERAKGNFNPFVQSAVVITSYPFAAKSTEFIRHIEWDMVVIDEAHRLRNVYKPTNKNANAIKRAVEDRFKVLLTATPLQNSLLELYGLVSVIDEQHFGSLNGFKERYTKRVADAESLKERLATVSKRTLRADVRHFVKFTDRKAIVQGFLPNADEQRLYDEVSGYLQEPNVYGLPGQQRHLMTMVLRKILASSTFAIANTLAAMSERLRGLIERSESSPEVPAVIAQDFEHFEQEKEEWQDEGGEAEGEDEVKPRVLTLEQIPQAKEELRRLEGFLALARSIRRNSKGEALLQALQAGFRRAEEAQAGQKVINRKAIIFTESRRTQDYLLEILEGEEAGFRGKVVLFNGTNADPRSLAIYDSWLRRHAGTDRVSGSKTADMRAALVEHFRDQAEIMLATEAAAEGINLQFCNLVVNYDLPWNPQRIEQRIGRCHRYGQKCDVVVVNFINQANAADQRVYELLQSKFALFNSVFGASDEVLGRLDRTGVGFERRINEIYQTCRSTSAIDDAFSQLEKELEGEITSAKARAREDLMRNFDHSVVEKVKVGTEATLDVMARRLWRLTRHALRDTASFDDRSHRFHLRKAVVSEELTPAGRYYLKGSGEGDGHLYRIGHPLAQHLIETSLAAQTPAAEVVFSLGSTDRQLAGLKPFAGRSGWLEVSRVRFQFRDGNSEEHIVTAAVMDDGSELDGEQAADLFDLVGTLAGSGVRAPSDHKEALARRLGVEQAAKSDDLRRRASHLLQEESTKLEAWEQDQRAQFRAHYVDLEEKSRVITRKLSTTMDFTESLSLEEERIRLRGAMDREEARFREQCRDLEEKKLGLVQQKKLRLTHEAAADVQFTLRWRLVD